MSSLAVLTIVVIIAILVSIISKKKELFLKVLGVEIILSVLLMLFAGGKMGIDWTCAFFILPLLMIVMAL